MGAGNLMAGGHKAQCLHVNEDAMTECSDTKSKRNSSKMSNMSTTTYLDSEDVFVAAVLVRAISTAGSAAPTIRVACPTSVSRHNPSQEAISQLGSAASHGTQSTARCSCAI